jgi:hypothetical protein
MKSLVEVKKTLKNLHVKLDKNFYDNDNYDSTKEGECFVDEYGIEFLKVFPGVVGVEKFQGETSFYRGKDFNENLRKDKDFLTVYDHYLSSNKASKILNQRESDRKVKLIFFCYFLKVILILLLILSLRSICQEQDYC